MQEDNTAQLCLMCIAILNDGKMLPKKKLQNCWNNNDDGAGMLYIQDGQLQVEKFPNTGGDSFTQFFDRYTTVKTSPSGDLPMLLHFRIATHGMSDEYLHPFLVTEQLGLIHNGVISGFGTKDKSDTAEFAQLVGTIPGVTIDTLDVPFVEDSIFTYLGSSNKVVFMDDTGDYRIFNEQLGEWIGNNWFSNDSHSRAVRYYGSTAVTGSSKYAYDWDDDYDEVAAYNASFGLEPYEGMTLEQLDDIAFDTQAPTQGTYDCPVCKTENTRVNFNSECMDCGAYLLDAVDEVYEMWDMIDLNNSKKNLPEA